MSTDEESYVNKNDQAPSYCDRCLFKNNLSVSHSVDVYKCMHEVYGSDHRPVQLGITLKDVLKPRFQDLNKLLNKSVPRQGYGELCIKLVELSQIDFSKSFTLRKLVVPAVTDANEIQLL